MTGLKRGTVRLMVHQDEWIYEAENTIRELKELLGAAAIDIQHIGSTAIPSIHVNHVNDDGTLFYGGFYHLCGTLSEGRSAWKSLSDKTAYWDAETAFSVSSNFHVSFHKDIVLLEKGFPLPVIQLDFTADIPWVLEKKNTYI